MATLTKDEQIQKLISVVVQKKEAIKSASQKPNWNTNCSFKYANGIADSFNIQTVSDVTVFVQALSFLLLQEGTYVEAVSRLGVKGDFKWAGFSVADWEADFKTRINKIQLKINQEELDSYEKSLNKLISKEAREEMELAELTKKILG
jgi:hypothetical protein